MRWIMSPQKLAEELINLADDCIVEDGTDELEVRVQVFNDHTYELHTGDPQYDTDHRGYWGNCIVTVGKEIKEDEFLGLAADLIDQVNESMAQAGEEDEDVLLNTPSALFEIVPHGYRVSKCDVKSKSEDFYIEVINSIIKHHWIDRPVLSIAFNPKEVDHATLSEVKFQLNQRAYSSAAIVSPGIEEIGVLIIWPDLCQLV